KSDYIPCIAWGRNARFCRSFEVGEKVAIEGRIQSREYVKKIDESLQEQKTAFEISISKISTGSNVLRLEEEAEFLFPSLELKYSEEQE
ncbi:MAG: single-stranded DNA-binding protein, partial [Clostridia bacterium]|nr:single-stranded DNA-binding protein [Clostridia bacterium]